MRSAYVLVAVALSTSSCSQAMTSASGGELAWLRGQPEIVAVHYAATHQFSVKLVGRRRNAGSRTTVPVNLPLTRRGRTLEASVLGRENIVYTIVLSRTR